MKAVVERAGPARVFNLLSPWTTPLDPLVLLGTFIPTLDSRPGPVHVESMGTRPVGPMRTAHPSIQWGPDCTIEGSPEVSILDTLEAVGLEPTAGCRRGVCHRCVVALDAGCVRDRRDERDVDAGTHIRICVTSPLSDISLDPIRLDVVQRTQDQPTLPLGPKQRRAGIAPVAIDVVHEKPDDTQYARHLETVDLDVFAAEIDALRFEVIDSLGPDDERYIRQLIVLQRSLELSGRAALLAGVFPPAWLAGVGLLSLAKILENMEIGHNVLHGQWDWLNDPDIHSTTWEWDHACPASQWRHSHNEIHHQWTNIEGVDHDIGYRLFRVHDHQDYETMHRIQPAIAVGVALGFDYAIALHDLDRADFSADHPSKRESARLKLNESVAKMGRQATKDYIAFPALSLMSFGPAGAVASATGALVANTVRNVWAFGVIFCGHFPEGVETFPPEAARDERRGAWYLRQILGSANFNGGPLIHLLSGNLDHQIEHHLFPDLPSNRYADLAPRVSAICERHGVPYHTRSFGQQLASVARKIWRLRKP